MDDPERGPLKGDARMVQVLAHAVRTRQRPLRDDLVVPFGAGVLRLPAAATEEIVALARRRPGTHNARRRFVESQVLRGWLDEYRRRLDRGRATTIRAWTWARPRAKATRTIERRSRNWPTGFVARPRWPRR